MLTNKVEFLTRFTLAVVVGISASVYVLDQKALATEIKIEMIKNNSNTEDKKLVVLSEKFEKALIVKKIATYENAPNLTDKELLEVLSIAGFKGSSLKIAWAVSKAESNGRPFSFNGNHKTGDSSYGIFQINMIGSNGPARRDKFNLDSNSDLFNPIKNAKIAYHMSNGGKNWSAWSAYRSGAYKLRLKDFPKGVNS